MGHTDVHEIPGHIICSQILDLDVRYHHITLSVAPFLDEVGIRA